MVPFITGVVYMFFPESPKYLMSKGRNDEALKVFKRVYEINTSEDECYYPVIICPIIHHHKYLNNYVYNGENLRVSE